MKKYLNLPTHTKWGWLVYLVTLMLYTYLLGILPSYGRLVEMIFSILGWGLMIATFIEIGTKLIGKNKIHN